MPATDDAVQRLSHEIEARLGRLRQKIRARFVLHGCGWAIAALSAGVLLYFALDRALDLPAPVRLVLSTAFAAYVGIGVRRRIVYPARRALSRDDVAIAVERRFPDLHERLISAVQLARSVERGASRGDSEAMISRLVDEAADQFARLPAERVLDPRRTVRVWTIASFATLVTGAVLLTNPAVAGVFLSRMVGSSESYPRQTRLVLELPADDPEFQVTRRGRDVEVVLPAGGDLPVIVRVEGVVPREVALVVDGGRGLAPQIAMSQRTDRMFRHVFRRVHRGFTFHARGGDDPSGDLRVTVITVDPPRVATIRAEITYPAYTGLPPTSVVGGSVEALVGSAVSLYVSSTSEVRDARLHLLDADLRLELVPTSITDDGATSTAYLGELRIERSDRYQIEFVGPTGIRNPHPGTYPIVAVEDFAPVAQLVSPHDGELGVALPTALLPILVAAEDDYGLRRVAVTTIAGQAEHELSFPLFEAAADDATREHVGGRLLEVGELGADGVSVGDTIVVTGHAVDNREPEPSNTELSRRQIHVVGPTDLGRRIAGHFRRIRESVDKALFLVADRRLRLDEVRAELEAGAESQALAGRLITIEVGQGRVLAESRRIHEELMRSFDVHLFNRLDESVHAPKVVQLYVSHREARPTAEAVDPEFYRAVVRERRSGAIGALEKTLDPILAMIDTADRLASDLAPSALQRVEAAGVTTERAGLAATLAEAAGLQEQIERALEALRSKLDEWNEFQDVITQTRAIRDKQKDLSNRTRALQGDTR